MDTANDPCAQVMMLSERLVKATREKFRLQNLVRPAFLNVSEPRAELKSLLMEHHARCEFVDPLLCMMAFTSFGVEAIIGGEKGQVR